MGLAATKNKQKLGLDPRNTAWSNDTSRFGHKHMEKMGWTPGSGLGMMPNATTTHVKVSIKDDNLGLGAKLRKKDKADEFDSGECAGLDAFQRLLGRLNGKEDKVSNELDIQKKENIINGKWGINFVKGDVLASTWDAKTKTLRLYSNDAAKRKQDSDDSDEEPKSKRAKKSKERSSDKADQEKKKSKKEKKLKKDKKGKKDKRDKKEKDEKKDKKDKSTHKKDKLGDIEKDSKHKRGSKDKKEKKEKKSKKDVKEKKDKSGARNSEVSRESMLKPKAAQDDAIASRLSIRSKWIKQKRAAVMDAKALNEIFMISS